MDQQDKYCARTYFTEVKKNSFSHKSKNPHDFSGIYVFYRGSRPVYVGISGTIIRRLKYHLYGKKENESSFVYLMAKTMFEKENGAKRDGKRKAFPFEKYRDIIQTE